MPHGHGTSGSTIDDIVGRLNQLDDAAERLAFIQTIPGLDHGQLLRLANVGRFGSEGRETVAEILRGVDLSGFDAGFDPLAGFGGGTQGGGTGSILPSGAPLPVSTTALSLGNSLAGSPAATGFPLFERTVQLILQADAARRATIDQNVSIIRTLIELERASPTRAAGLAAGLGLEGPNLSFVNALTSQGPAFGGLTAGGLGGGAFGGMGDTPSFGGSVAGQELSLPLGLSGQQLANLVANPNVAAGVLDVADFFGRPDFFRQSQAALLPTSQQLLGTVG